MDLCLLAVIETKYTVQKMQRCATIDTLSLLVHDHNHVYYINDNRYYEEHTHEHEFHKW